ncbi:MAG: hypothetical protein QM820_46960 [Minicystis sp.]
MKLSIERYAAVMAELAAAGDARGVVLARHGLDEARWDAVDTYWQAQISAALDQEDDGVAEIISAYAAAYEAAQRALAPPISIEQFAMVTRLLQTSGDLRAALAKVGVSLADYVRGTEHWSRQLATDPDVERRFDDVLRGR